MFRKPAAHTLTMCQARLYLGHIEEAGGAADQRAAREGQPRHGLQAALVERARAVLHARAAVQQAADARVALPALELLEGAEVGIPVVQRHHQPAAHNIDVCAAFCMTACGRRTRGRHPSAASAVLTVKCLQIFLLCSATTTHACAAKESKSANIMNMQLVTARSTHGHGHASSLYYCRKFLRVTDLIFYNRWEHASQHVVCLVHVDHKGLCCQQQPHPSAMRLSDMWYRKEPP